MTMSLRPKTTICFSDHAESSGAVQHKRTRVDRLADWKEGSQSENEDNEGAYVANRDLRTLYSQPDPTPEQRQNPLSLTDSVYTNGNYDIHQSIRALFVQSWDTNRSAGQIQGWIRVRGGGEQQGHRW